MSIPFVRRPEDVEKIREMFSEADNYIKVFARIENLEGLEEFENILQYVDGIIVMRNTLSMEF